MRRILIPLILLFTVALTQPVAAVQSYQYISLPGPGVQGRYYADPRSNPDVCISLLLNNAGPSAYISATVYDSGGSPSQYIIDRTTTGTVCISEMTWFARSVVVVLADANHYEVWKMDADRNWETVLIDCWNC